ncbi:MAG: LLM class flavin-dependent oxidoreductase [Pseudomonadota bacterium]
MELGLNTFGDVSVDATGELKPMDAVLRDVVEQAIAADAYGVDFIGLGEHHRDDFAISAPEILLGAIASATEHIKLGSAVTVLSTDDPVRVFQRFSTLHAISKGRAEIILGRGSFSESYALFGFSGADYDLLFEERLDLFAQLRKGGPIAWQGKTRPPLNELNVYPPVAGELKTWVGVGGTPQSVVRVAQYDLSLALAIIGGDPARFRPLVELYHKACADFGNAPNGIGTHSPGFVADTDEEARETFWPHYRSMMNRLGSERGWPPMSKDRYIAEIEHGSLYVGGPDFVAQKIARCINTLGLRRFDLKYATGPVPHAAQMRCIELYGTKVIPSIRDEVAAAA